MPRIVSVIGATGTQGGAVVDALLGDSTFVPRAIVREVASEASRSLRSKGAQVTHAESTDTASLKTALEGCEAVFLVTAPFVQQSEFDQARRVVDASKEAGVGFIVFSSLPNVTRETKGKLDKVYALDIKSEIEDYIQKSGVPHCFVYTGYFLENAWKYGFLKANTVDPAQLDYTVVRFTPEHTEPFTWVGKDLGNAVLALLRNYRDRPNDVLGLQFYALSQRLKVVLSKKVNYVHLESTGDETMDQMWDFHRDYKMYPGIQVPDPRLEAMGVKFSTCEDFVIGNNEKLLAIAYGSPKC